MPSSSSLQERVVTAAERALKQGGSVGPLELLQGLGFLYPGHVNDWQRGVPHYTPIEPHIQCGAAKLAEVYRLFAEWAATKGMKTVEAEYSRRGVGGVVALQVTVDGNEERERFFRTHYASAELSPKKAERLQQKLTKAPDLVVFITVADDTKCSECENGTSDKACWSRTKRWLKPKTSVLPTPISEPFAEKSPRVIESWLISDWLSK